MPNRAHPTSNLRSISHARRPEAAAYRLTDRTPSRGNRHVVLIGLMGAGKSAVGAELADVLDVPFLDNDLLLTGRTGSTAANLAEQLGGAALHRQELAVLESALERRDRCVIGAAASTVEAPRIKDLLAPHLVVWLTANVATLVERVRGPDHRPFLDDDPEATIRAQADRRRQTFAALADLVIDTSDQSPLQVALEVAGRITDDHRV